MRGTAWGLSADSSEDESELDFALREMAGGVESSDVKIISRAGSPEDNTILRAESSEDNTGVLRCGLSLS